MDDQLIQKLCNSIPMTGLKCGLHKPATVAKVCSELSCNKKPLMCGKCAIEDIALHGEHQGKILDLDSFINSFTTDMFRLCDQYKLLYQEFIKTKENQQLMNIIAQGDLHLKQIESQVLQQKRDINDDMDALQKKISDTINAIREENLRKLDDFYVQYQNSFSSLKSNIDVFFNMSRKYYFYSNANTLSMKLASLPTNEAQNMVTQLKHNLNLTKSLTSQGNNQTPLQMLTDLQTLARYLQKMIQQPPQYDRMMSKTNANDPNSMMESVVREVRQVLSTVIAGRLYVPAGVQKEQSLVGTGCGSTQLQLDAKNAEEFSLKPSKKYALDFPVNCAITLTDSVFVLASSNDATIRIFDAIAKKLQVYTEHTKPITYIEKLTTENTKSKVFATQSSDKLVVIWNIEDITVSLTPKIYYRILLSSIPLQILDLKDQTHLAIRDSNREIAICSYISLKVNKQNKSYHQGTINGLVLLRRGEKFISYSSDSVICIWRVLKTNSQDPVLNCEQTLYDPLYGNITQMFVTTQWSNQAVIVNSEGEIKIFDLNRNCVIFSQYGKRKFNPAFTESILIEEADRKISPTNWILTFSFNDNIAVQHRLTNSPFTMYTQDVKLEHKLSQMPPNAPKHRVLLYHSTQPATSNSRTVNAQLLFTNEFSQELLVYDIRGK